METIIQAIFFDVGGTLRVTRKVNGRNLDHIRRIQLLIGDRRKPEAFMSEIRSRERKYRHWCQKTLLEVTEAELWSKYILPEHPAEFVKDHAVELNQLWRESRTRCILPDAVETVLRLAQMGYRLGIISNTTSSVEAPQLLEENGISDLFETVILSTTFGKRKPHPSLFLAAARDLGVLPEHCAYVGDNQTRDLVGARQAGFAKVIIINVEGYIEDEFDPDDEALKDNITELEPDHRICQLKDLLDIFHQPAKKITLQQETPRVTFVYDAALSTMWGVDQIMPFAETFTAARRIGFPRFELNHKVTPGLFNQWDRKRCFISTVHDPCPAKYTYEEMKKRDIMISSMDESLRGESIDLIKRTIEWASRLGSRSVVIHAGSIRCDRSLEEDLRKMYQSGSFNQDKFDTLKERLIADRKKRVEPHLNQVLMSMKQIIDFARGFEINLALENRYRYYDIPLPDEMQLMLDQTDEDWYGFQYDTGHAHALQVLGLVEHTEWLRRFSDRMIGVHLHDVTGITDHQVPGKGEINFHALASLLPSHALRTLEVCPEATAEDLAAGMEHLVSCGCVDRILA